MQAPAESIYSMVDPNMLIQDMTKSNVRAFARLTCGSQRNMLCAMLACYALVFVHSVDAQSATAGLQVGLGAAVSRPVLSGDAQRYWTPLGSFGPGAGGQATVGYAWSSYGAAVSLEAATASVGPRSGGMFGVAVLGYWRPAIQVGNGWRPRATIGYVREGMLMDAVRPSEVNSSVTHVQTEANRERSVGISGNGARVGFDIARPLSRITVVTGVDVDAIRFDTVTDDSEDISLNHTNWSMIPHFRLGILFHP